MANRETDYLIIGNSAAGVSAAEHIRAADPQGRVLVVGDEPHAAYGRPLISHFAKGDITEDLMGFKDALFFESLDLETLLGPSFKAVDLDAEAHSAVLENGDAIVYGSCLIATGGVPLVPPIGGLDGRDNVYQFRTLDQAKHVRRAAIEATAKAHAEGRMSRALVVGAGLVGLKAAEALCCLVDDVVVVGRAPRILRAILDEHGSSMLQDLLARHRINCLTGVSVDELAGEGHSAASAVLTNGDTVDCDLVVLAAGTKPNAELAVRAGATQLRGLVCGADLRTSLPDVFAAGDVAQITEGLGEMQQPLALWPNAVRQGKVAGKFMAGAPDARPLTGDFAVNAVDFFDISLLTAGIVNPPEGGGFEVRVRAQGREYAKFVAKGDRLVGYILLNRPASAGIYTTLIERQVPLSSLVGDLFGRAPLNLDFPADMRWERLHRGYPCEFDERGWRTGR